MDCYAWKIPEGCYAAGSGCPTPVWFWIALAAAGLLILGSKGKSTPKRQVRARRR